MTPEKTAQPPQSRTAYVLGRLKEDLNSGLLSPGEQLRQSAIAERYGVSPTPVREALRMLAADGAITYTSHRGATVRDYSPQLAADLYRARAEVEALAVEMAVERMDDDAVDAVFASNAVLLAARASGAAPATLSLLNKNLHFSIYEHSSPVMVELLHFLWARFKPSITLWSVQPFSEALEADHSSILDAIRRRDAGAAAQHMRAHVMNACKLRETSDELKAVGPSGPQADPVAPVPEAKIS